MPYHASDGVISIAGVIRVPAFDTRTSERATNAELHQLTARDKELEDVTCELLGMGTCVLFASRE